MDIQIDRYSKQYIIIPYHCFFFLHGSTDNWMVNSTPVRSALPDAKLKMFEKIKCTITMKTEISNAY